MAVISRMTRIYQQNEINVWPKGSFNHSLRSVVASEACSYEAGAVTSYVFLDKSETKIAYAARSLIVKEALAIIFAVKRLHKTLYGRMFTD